MARALAVHACALSLAVLALGAACTSGPRAVSWEIRRNGHDVRAIRVELLRDCDGNDVLWREDVVRDEALATAPPTLAPGTYCLRARGVDEGCDVIAWAEVEVTLPSPDDAPVILSLGREPAMAVPPICESEPCDDPLCEGEPADAGRDAGRDAGPPAMPDASRDSATDAPDAFESVGPSCPHGGTSLTLAQPTGVRPWSGWVTGPAAEPVATSFAWTDVPGATCYEVQLGDACSSGLPGCVFRASAAYTTPDTETEIPVGIGAPGARRHRHLWRVRGCNGEECGSWSDLRYLTAGASRTDFDGSGTTDLAAVGTLTGDPPRLLVWTGGDPSSHRVMPLPEPHPSDVRAGIDLVSCDLNADGHADLAVSVSTYRNGMRTSAGIVQVLMGPSITSPTQVAVGAASDELMGAALACGDIDHDGFDDLLIGAPGAGRVLTYLGGIDAPSFTAPVMLSAPAGAVGFGHEIALGDVGGPSGAPDGLLDVLVGSPASRRVDVFVASASGVAGTSSLTLRPGSAADGTSFGLRVHVTELDGDLGEEVIVGAPDADSGRGAIFVYDAPAATATIDAIVGPIAADGEVLFAPRFGAAILTSRPNARFVRPPTILVGAPGVNSAGTANGNQGALYSIGPARVPASPVFGRAVGAFLGASLAVETTDPPETAIVSEPGTGRIWRLDGAGRLGTEVIVELPHIGSPIVFGGH